MSGRWWRAYDEAMDDPKLQRLSSDLFRAWFNLMCMASKRGGELPCMEDIAFGLRLAMPRAERMVAELIRCGLIDDVDGVLTPHNWSGRQFQSDNSTGRVKRFRNRQRTVSETPPEAETEADKNSVANATGADAPPADPVYTDSKHELWGEGVPILRQLGVKDREARSNIGRWLKATGDDAASVLGAIQRARDHRVIDPIPWITRALRTPGQPHGKSENSLVAAGRSRIAELDDIIAAADRAAGAEAADGVFAGDSNVRLLPARGRGFG